MLEELNPWWIGEKDKDLEELENLKYSIYPRWIDKLSLNPFSLNFIIGLRRVGKTIGIKLLIEKLLRKIKKPFSIFYFSCDILESYRDLLEIIEEYRKIKKRKGIKMSFIFLDEITLLEDWWRAIKFAIDRHWFDNDVLVLSGSSSLLIKQHIETFSGRKGKGKIVEVHPLNFFEYYSLFFKEFFQRKGKEIFENYLETGGFLAALNERVTDYEYISIIKADIKKIERSTDIARDIMRSIFLKAPNAFSYHSIAKDSGLSVNTVREYIEIFKNMFLLAEVNYIGLDGKVYPRKEKKFVIRDPFLVRALALWTKTDLKKDFLYEWVVQEHLLRKFGEVYYFKNSYEIDCIAGDLKIEVKAGKPHRKYPKGVRVLEEQEIPMFLIKLFPNKFV